METCHHVTANDKTKVSEMIGEGLERKQNRAAFV